MFSALVLVAVVTLPSLPSEFVTTCSSPGGYGRVSTEGVSNVISKGVDSLGGGSVMAHFRVAGYAPGQQPTGSDELLVIRLDNNPALYTNLRTIDPYGSFDVGFNGLSAGFHALNVAILRGAADAHTSYSFVCFKTP